MRAAGRQEPPAGQDAAPNRGGGDTHGPGHDGGRGAQVCDRQVTHGGAGVGHGAAPAPPRPPHPDPGGVLNDVDVGDIVTYILSTGK
jgi:hypothetical protein